MIESDEGTESFRNTTVTITTIDSDEYKIHGKGGQLAEHTLTTEGNISVNGASIDLDGELVLGLSETWVSVVADVESGDVTIEV